MLVPRAASRRSKRPFVADDCLTEGCISCFCPSLHYSSVGGNCEPPWVCLAAAWPRGLRPSVALNRPCPFSRPHGSTFRCSRYDTIRTSPVSAAMSHRTSSLPRPNPPALHQPHLPDPFILLPTSRNLSSRVLGSSSFSATGRRRLRPSATPLSGPCSTDCTTRRECLFKTPHYRRGVVYRT